jgi:hypothetical protein
MHAGAREMARNHKRNDRPLRLPKPRVPWPLDDEPPRRTPATIAMEETRLGLGSISDRHTAWMRAQRKRPEIMEAIIALHGGDLVEHPYKMAGEILPRLNARLKSQGHKPTSKKAVYTRLTNSNDWWIYTSLLK